jgi:DNA-binding transcriptional regulator YdaS (Cro superfamily)
VDSAIRASGGLAALAKALGISPQAVDKWRRKGVPAERVLAVEATSGISRHELRPDLYPEASEPSLLGVHSAPPTKSDNRRRA